jgi:hypothetical protein
MTWRQPLDFAFARIAQNVACSQGMVESKSTLALLNF